MLWRLDQKMEDHLRWAEGESVEMQKRIKELEDFRANIERPVRAAGWIIIGLVGSFVAAVGAFIFKLITRVNFTGP